LKVQFSRRIFENYSNIKFYETLLVGVELFHEDGRADRKDETYSRFFCSFVKAPNEFA